VTDIVVSKPPDSGRRTAFAIALALISILVPLGVLWLLTLRQSRLPRPDGLLVARVPAPLGSPTGGGGGGLDGPLTMDDLHPVRGDRRRFSLPGGAVLRRRIPRHPFASPTAQLSFPGRACATAQAGGIERKDGRAIISNRFRHVVAVAMHGDGEGAAEALLLTPRRTSAAEANAIVQRELPIATERLMAQIAGPGDQVANGHVPVAQPPTGDTPEPPAGGDGDAPVPAPVRPSGPSAGPAPSSAARKPPPAPGWL
jgi:hypothetical protein